MKDQIPPTASNHEHGPFGNPDGSRADLDEVLKGFIQFGGIAAWGGLATKEDDFRARVIVGRKGSGKTVYLRRLRAHASTHEESYYADHIQQDYPPTQLVVKFSQWFPEAELTEQWQKVWRRAIIRSVVSHVINREVLRNRVPKTKLEALKTGFEQIIRPFRAPVSIFSQVAEVVESGTSSHRVLQVLDNPLWGELEYTLAECIRDLPPLCFYIDAIDEEFAHAPMYWLRCQKGLFYTTMRLLRDDLFGSRLHIVVCIRDIVLSSVLRSEHRTRYIGEEHTRILNWNLDAIRHFLREKLEIINARNFILNPEEDGRTLKSWLGRGKIMNLRRNIEEDLESYLLRHTRLLPRDIVLLGNFLCQEIAKAKLLKNGKLSQEQIRETVAKVARIIGNEQLAICGNHLLSDSMPPKAGVYGYSEVFTSYTGSNEFLAGAGEEIKKVVSLIGRDRFSKQDLKVAMEVSKFSIGNPENLPSLLWQHGLLGYIDKARGEERPIFYSEEYLDEFNLPERDEYVFHSCLIDAADITPIGSPGGVVTEAETQPPIQPTPTTRRAANVFISYSHKDVSSRQEFEAHLKLLQRQGAINMWSDREILPSEEWKGQIDEKLNEADIVVLLVSSDFIASSYCYDIEMKTALERHSEKRTRIVPIIVRDCDWSTAPFGKFQALPSEGKAVSRWRTRDTAWKDVVSGLRRLINAS